MQRVQSGQLDNVGVQLDGIGKDLTLFANATRIKDESNLDLGLVVVFDDASEQIKAQRVAAWREVARRIAHEIKNPITPIKLSAQRLLRRFGNQFGGADRDVFETCITTIISEVDSLKNLVNEFSRFSRLPTIRPQPDNVNEVIGDVIGLYQVSYPHICFDTSGLAANLPRVSIDREQMSRVFVNLITNGISAIAGSGANGKIEFRSELLDDYHTVRVEVADNGTGIPEKIKGRVLEPYFSTKKEGTGLGLAIVNQVVADHGGYLRIFDNQPAGTIVEIELPLGATL